MPKRRTPPTDQDGGWKQIIEALLSEFLLFFFPDVHAEVNFQCPVKHLEQELRRLFPASATSRGVVDKVIQVTRKGGGDALLIIHVEIQGQVEREFSRRMYVYHYRLADRYGLPVTSLAVLADPDPAFRPVRYVESAPGTRVVFDFSAVKLLDFKTERQLLNDPSPFAVASLIQLRKLRIGSATEPLLASKLEMARELFRRGYSSEKIRALYRFLDYIMRLPPDLEAAFEQDIVRQEKNAVTYLSRLERRAWERGMARGEATLLLRLLEHKFGEVSTEIRRHVEAADAEQLLIWAERFVNAQTPADIFGDETPPAASE